jgi:MFS family permease
VALPSIQKDLHFKSKADLQWVINAYVLTAGFAPRRAGRRPLRPPPVFVSGVVVFAAASLSCGLANSPALLVAHGPSRAGRSVHGPRR